MVISILMPFNHNKNKAKFIEKEYAYLLSGSSPVIGFTKDSHIGKPVRDTKKALAFLGRRFGVAYMKQVHGSDVKIVKKAGRYRCDGIITNKKNVALVVKTADCIPIIVYNNKSGIVGAVHMGWRSAKDGILANIPYDLSGFKVVAGPGMRKCCYEVGREFLGYDNIGPYAGKRSGRYYFDPIRFIKDTLASKGLKERNFIDMEVCSQCSGYKVFSYRKTKTEGRTLTFVVKF